MLRLRTAADWVMKAIALLVLLLAPGAGLAAEKSKVPADVAAVVDRIEICAHLAGEFGSGDPERERELGRSWDRARCDDRFLGKDIKRLKKKYARQPKAIAPLDAELRRVSTEYGIEF